MSKVALLRNLIRELRRATPASKPLKDDLMYQYIISQYRKNHTTSEQLCRAREEMEFMANCYLTYLSSSRLQDKINKDYQGKGERSIKDTAALVGFKLPHDPE